MTDRRSGKTAIIEVVVSDNSTLVSYLTCPDDHHPHIIDLGLPSGTKWACCNVGADKPESFGSYYAWGETEEKDVYNWSTYVHCDGSDETCYNLGNNISGTVYDAAYIKWGCSWAMPSDKEITELVNNCTKKLTGVNDVQGWMFIGSNGGNIFLPSGDVPWIDLYDSDDFGHYWYSTLDRPDSSKAYSIFLHPGGVYTYYDGRYYGHMIRPVSK